MDVFIDLDNTLTNIYAAVARIHRQRETLTHWPPGDYRIARVFGFSDPADFWAPIDHHGREFWASLEPLPWCDELVELASQWAGGDGVTILTRITRGGDEAGGKLDWLERHFGKPFDDFELSTNKSRLAAPDRVLIDDSDAEVEAFIAAGGKAILFPSVSNRLHCRAHHPLDYVRQALEEINLRTKGRRG